MGPPENLTRAITKIKKVGAYLFPEQKRIMIDEAQPQAKWRWNEAHEIIHSVVPWHEGAMIPGQGDRGTHDYKRHGTTSLFAALELKTNQVVGQMHRRHRSVEFRKFLDVIESQVPEGLDVHLIVDNYATHKTAMIRKWFAKRARFHVHFTPTYGSWINLVERWFAELTNKRIRRGVLRSVKELETAIREYIQIHNQDPTPVVWARTADQILASIARYAQRTLNAHPARLIARTIGTGD
jgi:transposase